MLQNQAHFVWQEALMCLKKKKKERPPAPGRTKAGKCKPQCEGQEVNWSPAGLSCSMLNSLVGWCWLGGACSLGLWQPDWFGDCCICFSLAPTLQVLPLIILIHLRGALPCPAFLHNSFLQAAPGFSLWSRGGRWSYGCREGLEVGICALFWAMLLGKSNYLCFP